MRLMVVKTVKMKHRYLFFLLLSVITGCSLSTTQTIEPLTFQTPSPAPFSTSTLSPSPMVTISPAPTLTPTFPPYRGEPFSIVFVRGGNLWFANIDDPLSERKLTF